jgi:hypothetical protein
MIATNAKRPQWTRLMLLLLVLAVLTAAGCGGDDEGSKQPAEDPELVEQASAKIERAAASVTDPFKSRYIPGKKEYKVVCLDPEQARAKRISPEFIQCHVEAFSTPTQQRPQSVYIESEDWRVSVEPDGTVSDPVIVDGYRIRDFLRKDNRLGCSVGRTPQDRCKSPFPPGG